MKHVRKSVLLWYSPREMYDLVTGVAAYPSFLPWCQSAEVLARHADGVTARDREGQETFYPADAVVFAVGITGEIGLRVWVLRFVV